MLVVSENLLCLRCVPFALACLPHDKCFAQMLW